jgi:hypothetical protein
MTLNGGVTLDGIADMDFITFDSVLKVSLQVEAARRLTEFRTANHAAQGDNDSIKALTNDLMRQAYPEQGGAPGADRPLQGVGGLRKFLAAKGKPVKQGR